jgi:single-strand DNA-binding protein
VDYFPVVAWGRLAEVVRDYCNKGRQIAVVGRLQNRSWEGQDGNTRYVTEVVAEEFELLGQPSTQEARQQPQKAKQTEQTANPNGFTELDEAADFPFEIDEDLPF